MRKNCPYRDNAKEQDGPAPAKLPRPLWPLMWPLMLAFVLGSISADIFGWALERHRGAQVAPEKPKCQDTAVTLGFVTESCAPDQASQIIDARVLYCTCKEGK